MEAKTSNKRPINRFPVDKTMEDKSGVICVYERPIKNVPWGTYYNIVSYTANTIGTYHELYGGFYQGFYKLFGYPYEVLPTRYPKGWTVEMTLKPRFTDAYIPPVGATTLNDYYPDNSGIFFYMGTRAENKYWHHAAGQNPTDSGYTRVTESLTGLSSCMCSTLNPGYSTVSYTEFDLSQSGVTISIPANLSWSGGDQILVYHDPLQYVIGTVLNYSASTGELQFTVTKRVGKGNFHAWVVDLPDYLDYALSNCVLVYPPTGYTDYHNVVCSCCNPNVQIPLPERPAYWDSISNAFAIKFSGDPHNPKICVRTLTFTGDCQLSGSCETLGPETVTGYSINNYCSDRGIYDDCSGTTFDNIEHWVLVDAVFERYSWFDFCDLYWRGGLGVITNDIYTATSANRSISLIEPPITHEQLIPPKEEYVQLNYEWLLERFYRVGKLKLYVNGKHFQTFDDFEEIIPRGLYGHKENQVGVPFNISWGGGTQGLHENLIFSSCTLPYTDYIQDPESFPVNVLSGTTFAGMKTNILLEQNFGGTFEGGISQFRMYVDPLTAPEIKHNFKILKDRFSMFDPDCPDCNPVVCDVNDFEYNVIDTTPTPTPTNTITPTVTPTNTLTPTVTPTNTPTPTASQVFGENLCGPPCGLGFDTFSSNTVGQLVVGSITGGCGSITSYVIYWYDSNSVIQLVSGFGPPIAGYTTYTVTHPLTGPSSPPLPAGQYTPILQAIVIAGTTYTSTGLSGTTAANLNCFTNLDINVESFSCQNCTEVGHYKCRKTYTTAPGSIVTPGTLSTTFALDPTQPYFAFAMKGEAIFDTLKITFVNADGSNYNSPIVVEYLETGVNVPNGNDFRDTTVPKRIPSSYNTTYYAKPINLTNFIINSGDYLILEVIPNTSTNNTSWDLYFTCLENFDCVSCLENYTPFKISASTLSSSVNACNELQIQANIIGCPTYTNEDIFKYMHSVINPNLPTFIWPNSNGSFTRSTYYNLAGHYPWNIGLSFNGTCYGGGNAWTTSCQTTPNNTITLNKTGSIITITCSSIIDRDTYYNSYIYTLNNIIVGWVPTPPTPSNINYYQYIELRHLKPLSISSSCGDNQYTVVNYPIHPSSVVTIGGGVGAYTMTINMATITNQYPNSSCNGCYGMADYYVNTINGSVAAPNVNDVSNNGLRYDYPFHSRSYMFATTPTTPNGPFGSASLYIPYYSTRTLPYSGSPLTIIPSLSATTCDFPWMTFNNNIDPNNGNESQWWEYDFTPYRVYMTDINNPNSFEIRLVTTGAVIYQKIGTNPGVIIDPTYFV